MTALPLTGGTAVVARRYEKRNSADLFPTPPWATRALFEHVLPKIGVLSLAGKSMWEPAAGLGHMSEVLKEYGAVYASDLYDWHQPDIVTGIDFTNVDPNRRLYDWIVTNPPFIQGEKFLEQACSLAKSGVAFLVRTAFLETEGRYALFQRLPPRLVAVFSERVPMCKGRWDPKGSTATCYAWIVWQRNWQTGEGTWMSEKQRRSRSFELMLIPPVCKATLSREKRTGFSPPASPPIRSPMIC